MKKIKLERETLRRLTLNELVAVHGNGFSRIGTISPPGGSVPATTGCLDTHQQCSGPK